MRRWLVSRGAPIAIGLVACCSVLARSARPDDGPPKAVDQRSRSQALGRGQSLAELKRFDPSGGRTHVDLSVQYGENTINGTRLRHRSYDGDLVGPTIRVRPGEVLEVHLENHLPREAGGGHGRFNTTSLHTHGLHVSPSGEADNIFLDVKPGEEFDFRYPIPADHPPGTYWYHPHRHGSVGLQVASGMAGALIVEGGLDEVPEIMAAKERVLVLQQFRYRDSGGKVAELEPSDLDRTAGGKVEMITAINGVVSPVMIMHPGEVQRWRIVHAGLIASIDLNLEGHPLREIASDGIALGTMADREVLELQPGYRSDVLVKASTKPGKYLLSTEVKDRTRSVRNRLVDKSYIATVLVVGTPDDMPLPAPAALARFAPFKHIEDSEIVRRRALKFSIGPAAGAYSVDGKVFEEGRIDQTLTLGQAEEWTISSEVENHPFHIHVNPFEVISKDPATGAESRVWRDTLLVSDGQTATIRHRFEDHPGWTVLHCHNLDHEDAGMMQEIEIVDPARPAKAAAASTPKAAAAPLPLPRPAPAWTLLDPAGKARSLADYRGRPVLLVLNRGLGCPHCSRQVTGLAGRSSRFRELGVEIVAAGPEEIEPAEADRYRSEFGVGFPILADPDLAAFRSYGCLDPGPLHGTFLIDARGDIRWQAVGDQPELDIDRILKAAEAVVLGRG